MKTPIKIGQRMLPLLGVVLVMGALAAVWGTLGRSHRRSEFSYMQGSLEIGRTSAFVNDPTTSSSRKYLGEQHVFKAKFEDVVLRAEQFYKSKGFIRHESRDSTQVVFMSRDGQLIGIAKGNRLSNSQEEDNADYVSITIVKKTADFLPRIVTPINE